MVFLYTVIMKKINVVKNNNDYQKIINNNKVYRNNCFVIYIDSNKLNYSRFGISVSKKIGNAVVRNYYKRIIRNICDNNFDYHKNIDYIIILRKDCLKMNYQEIEDNLISLINKISEDKNEEIQ